MSEAEIWEERYLLEAQKYARLLLSVTERELEMFRERVAAKRHYSVTIDDDPASSAGRATTPCPTPAHR